MIIECENCASRFNLDETLLKAGGSRVRCSVCKHVFIAHPIEKVPFEKPTTNEFLGEEAFPFDSSAAFGEEETGRVQGATESDFDQAFEEAMEEVEIEKPVSPEQLLEEEEEEVATAETTAIAREEPEVGPEAALVAAPKAKRGRSRSLLSVLLIILIIFIGAAAVFFYAPHLIPDSIPFLKSSSERQEVTDSGVARLSFKAVTGSFVQSNTAEQLFVIKGMVTNNYPKPRSFIRVKGSIQDDKGKTVKMREVYAGNTFTEEQIREKPLEELQEGLKDRFGRGRINFNLQTGGTIPFMIILENLPENISEFTVEAVSSTPQE